MKNPPPPYCQSSIPPFHRIDEPVKLVETHQEIIIGIDATRSRSGGAIAHMIGILDGDEPAAHGIQSVHLWAFDEMLDRISEKPWLVKHRVPSTHQSILHQLYWQRYVLPKEAKKRNISVLFNTDSSSVCPFTPSVTLNQDLLSYEPGEKSRYPFFSRARLRLEAIGLVQKWSLERSDSTIFLSEHAKSVFTSKLHLNRTVTIPHAVGTKFHELGALRHSWPKEGPLECLYVSNAAPYKHQWCVIEAIHMVRSRTGRDVRLRLVGGGRGPAHVRMLSAVQTFDPERRFIKLVPFVSSTAILDELAHADFFVFASSCETFGITLLEAMAAGLPIACSNRSSLPELILDGALYFDPEAPIQIADRVEELIQSEVTRARLAKRASDIAKNYSWKESSASTWRILSKIAQEKEIKPSV